MSLLVTYEILGLFVNVLTADGKYSVKNGEKFWQPNVMHLSKKQKNLFEFFAKSRKFTSNFWKKDDPHSLCMPEIIDCEPRC